MNTHDKFLEFNGKNIFFVNEDGVYWIALKPILDALNLPSDRYLKRAKRDAFFSTCLDTVSIQLDETGGNQARKMVCLPEKFIYGWICTLNSDDPELTAFKHTCHELLHSFFRGTITNRKQLLLERTLTNTEIHNIKKSLKDEDEKYQKLEKLEIKKKAINAKLRASDNDLIDEPELFN